MKTNHILPVETLYDEATESITVKTLRGSVQWREFPLLLDASDEDCEQYLNYTFVGNEGLHRTVESIVLLRELAPRYIVHCWDHQMEHSGNFLCRTLTAAHSLVKQRVEALRRPNHATFQDGLH